jgi:hypothetical protein
MDDYFYGQLFAGTLVDRFRKAKLLCPDLYFIFEQLIVAFAISPPSEQPTPRLSIRNTKSLVSNLNGLLPKSNLILGKAQ